MKMVITMFALVAGLAGINSYGGFAAIASAPAVMAPTKVVPAIVSPAVITHAAGPVVSLPVAKVKFIGNKSCCDTTNGCCTSYLSDVNIAGDPYEGARCHCSTSSTL